MNTALIVAAGSSSRMMSKESKILYKINGKPLFLYSIETFLELNFKVVLVVAKENIDEIKKYVEKEVELVIGGDTRGESVLEGLKEVETPYVYIHDAARPLISKKVILEIEKEIQVNDAVLLAQLITSALKMKNKKSIASLNRDEYLLAETPQTFLTEKIKQAYLKNKENYDDDIALYQKFYPNEKISVIYNEEPNPKITYKKDLINLEKQLKREVEMRIGHSFDIHKLSSDRPLILGGIDIPHEKGLLGHSDADVLLHVIAEAILGALNLGDLGTIYPDTDDKNRGISSAEMLKTISNMMKEKGYQIVNIDSTVYAELPKLNPFINHIKENICRILEIETNKISVKATTYEKLDAIGQKKAIAAEAVVLLKEVK